MTALGIEFCVGGSVKWLCGGPGAGWLYVRPDLAEQLSPAFAGWQGHARPFSFETEMEPAAGAARFLTGTPNVAANYAASAGYEIIREIGVDRIRANSMRQTALLVELVDAAGFELTSPREPAIRGGSVVFRVPDFQAVHAELAAREIICDYRPDAGLRFGPHFFTTDDELRFAVDQVDRDPRLRRPPGPRGRRGCATSHWAATLAGGPRSPAPSARPRAGRRRRPGREASRRRPAGRRPSTAARAAARS